MRFVILSPLPTFLPVARFLGKNLHIFGFLPTFVSPRSAAGRLRKGNGGD